MLLFLFAYRHTCARVDVCPAAQCLYFVVAIVQPDIEQSSAGEHYEDEQVCNILSGWFLCADMWPFNSYAQVHLARGPRAGAGD